MLKSLCSPSPVHECRNQATKETRQNAEGFEKGELDEVFILSINIYVKVAENVEATLKRPLVITTSHSEPETPLIKRYHPPPTQPHKIFLSFVKSSPHRSLIP